MESRIKIKVWMSETKTPRTMDEGRKEKGQYQGGRQGQGKQHMVRHNVPEKTHGEGKHPG